MELRDAFDQITTIRTQLAATERLRSLRAVTVALSGFGAIAVAAVQPHVLDDPMRAPHLYLMLWVGTAVLFACASTIEVIRRARSGDSALGVANLRLAALQFVPSLVAGAVITAWVATRQTELLWILPGMWLLLFGLGNLAAQQVLPSAAKWIGVLYLCSGTWCLWLGEAALDPWCMGLPFAVGQFPLAGVLWWHHERSERRGLLEQGGAR